MGKTLLGYDDNSIYKIINDEKENDKIQLEPHQIAAYWVVNAIKAKLDELYKEGASIGSEDIEIEDFLYAFSGVTERKWRNIYLELAEMIKKDIKNNIPNQICGYARYYIDTDIDGHNRLNEELSEILRVNVPDIRLSSNKAKESVIFIDSIKVDYMYKSTDARRIPNAFDSKYNYVLTGDEVEFKFLNLIKTVLLQLANDKDKENYSKDLIKEIFCKTYIERNASIVKFEDLCEEFEKVLSALSKQGFKLSWYWKEGLYCYPKLRDSFDACLNWADATWYSEAIRQEYRKINKNGLTKN